MTKKKNYLKLVFPVFSKTFTTNKAFLIKGKHSCQNYIEYENVFKFKT